MKILAKLLTGFIAVAVLCGIVGVVGISQITSLDKSITRISVETIPTLNYLAAIEAGLEKLKGGIRSITNPHGH
jgi:CHASE3 domain sensor protein